jgi:hypothetical protein
MDATVREDFFLASRDRVRKNEAYEEVVDHLKDALKEHAGLRQLNAARRKKEIEDTLNDEDETKSLFTELLKSDPALARLFGSGDRLVTKAGPGPEAPFTGKQFPTYFRLTKNPSGGLVRQCPVNLTCRLEFETDAVNDYFKRTDSPGSISVDPPNIIEHSHLWNGRFSVQVRVPWNAKPGDRINVRFTVEDIQTEMRSAPFISTFTLIAGPEAEPRKPGGDSESKEPKTRPGNISSGPTLAIPEVNEKHFQNPRPSLEVRYDDQGQREYFLNLDNAYLLTELTRTKEEDRPLVKFWFKYGLLLCALGMLKEQDERTEAKKNTEEDETDEENQEAGNGLKQVSSFCDGIAGVIIPIIRSLYKGPHALMG